MLVSPAQAQRIDPGAQDVRAYRLTPEVIGKLPQVMLALDDGYRPPSAEAVRLDIAIITVLTMAMPDGGSFTDCQAQEMESASDHGNPELSAAIRQAGCDERAHSQDDGLHGVHLTSPTGAHPGRTDFSPTTL